MRDSIKLTIAGGLVAAAVGVVVVNGMGLLRRPNHSGAEVAITSADQFAQEVERAPGVVLVDFWAPWCGPCRHMNPVVAAVAEAQQGRLKVVKVNVDENRALAERFRVRSIPTFMVFKDGAAVDMILGARPKDEFAAWVASHLPGG